MRERAKEIELVAACGLYCGNCRAYIQGKCDGLEMSIKNCTIFPIYLCTVFSVYFFNLDSADAVLYEFPKILTILE